MSRVSFIIFKVGAFYRVNIVKDAKLHGME